MLTGTNDGAIWSLTPDGNRVDRLALTGGRPLGLEWLPDGRLLVCDAHLGLLAVEPRGGDLEALVTSVGGEALRFTNNAAVAHDGTIYFSDSSRHFGVDEWKSDLIMHTMSGRLLRREPDGQVDTALDGVGFANGVALTPDGFQVWVAELALRRVRWLTTVGRELAAITELPGYADNLASRSGSDHRRPLRSRQPCERLHRRDVPCDQVNQSVEIWFLAHHEGFLILRRARNPQ